VAKVYSSLYEKRKAFILPASVLAVVLALWGGASIQAKCEWDYDSGSFLSAPELDGNKELKFYFEVYHPDSLDKCYNAVY
jgi:hypothetical protein